MASNRVSTWQDRLKACFRWRQRLLHVFGAPAALGAVAAVGSASVLNADTGLALGALTAGIGTLIAGYYVVSGFDRGVERLLQDEAAERANALEHSELSRVLAESEPELRAQLERILHAHAAIEAVFTDGIDDQVEAILQNSRADLAALRDRAIAMVKLHRRLVGIVQQSNAGWLDGEAKRMDAELARTPEGGVRDALLAARESTVRALMQWRNAVEKQAQVRNVLTLIENSLHEFKLAMELRKADAALGTEAHSSHVSELQGRLIAAGDACDELVGRGREDAPRARTRRRA
jgi:hypothetical protein